MIFDLGVKIKNLRKEKNISQEELAKKAGISRTTLSKIENGYFSKVSVVTLEKILAILGYTLEIKPKNPFVKN
jgi:transcriptional regulator with XRE-family HTH domain